MPALMHAQHSIDAAWLAFSLDPKLWSLLIDLPALFDIGADVVVYLAFAVVGSLIFIFRLALTLFLGADGDVDMDFGGDIDVGHGAGFGLLSLFSITAFIMGAGWAGLAARLEWGLGPVPAAFSSAGIGFTLMVLASTMMFVLQRAVHVVKIDHRTAVGRTGTAYQNIPARGKGVGKVRVVVSSQSMILPAVSTGDAIASFASVRVLEVRDDNTLVVEPTGDG